MHFQETIWHQGHWSLGSWVCLVLGSAEEVLEPGSIGAIWPVGLQILSWCGMDLDIVHRDCLAPGSTVLGFSPKSQGWSWIPMLRSMEAGPASGSVGTSLSPASNSAVFETRLIVPA